MGAWLQLILEYLIARVGKEVLDWSFRQVIEYFSNNPAEGRAAAQICGDQYVEGFVESDDDPFFWDKGHTH